MTIMVSNENLFSTPATIASTMLISSARRMCSSSVTMMAMAPTGIANTGKSLTATVERAGGRSPTCVR